MSKKQTNRKPSMPLEFPCGCVAVRKSNGQVAQCLILPDGMRICQHGRRWRCMWEEVK